MFSFLLLVNFHASGEFYVQLTDELPKLESLMTLLKSLQRNMQPIQNVPQEGEALMCIYREDGNPYRATMIGLSDNSPAIQVLK